MVVRVSLVGWWRVLFMLVSCWSHVGWIALRIPLRRLLDTVSLTKCTPKSLFLLVYYLDIEPCRVAKMNLEKPASE